MSYLLKRSERDGGGFVARAGEPRSYVKSPARAQVYATPELAEVNRCHNEVIVKLDGMGHVAPYNPHRSA